MTHTGHNAIGSGLTTHTAIMPMAMTFTLGVDGAWPPIAFNFTFVPDVSTPLPPPPLHVKAPELERPLNKVFSFSARVWLLEFGLFTLFFVFSAQTVSSASSSKVVMAATAGHEPLLRSGLGPEMVDTRL